MNAKDFTESQRQAVLDLLVLAMYADGHLASAEDARVQRWLVAMGYASEFERNHQFNAAVARVRQQAQLPAMAEAHAATLAQAFTTQEQRRRVHDVLEDLLKSDDKVATQESAFLSVIRQQLQI